MSRVLVLTNSYDDAHFDAVAAHLQAWDHQVIRLNVDAVLRGVQSVTWDYQQDHVWLTMDDRCIDLLRVDSVWFRKPFGFGSRLGFTEFINDPVQRSMLGNEVRELIYGLCSALDSKLWVNHPKHMHQARLKPYQLRVAKALGLNVPPTMITSSPEEARLFCSGGPAVFKALAVEVLDYGDVVGSIHTTPVTERLLAQLDLVRSQPSLFQRRIEKSAELRVTCMGDEIFVARQTLLEVTDAVDWRPLQGAESSQYEPWGVSPELSVQIQALMKKLKLTFATMDFAVGPNDELWFLEVNPNGQWLGYTDEIGMPAASAMAKLLVP